MSNRPLKAWLNVSLALLVISFVSAVALNIHAGYLADEYAGKGKEYVGITKDLGEWSAYFFLCMGLFSLTLAIIRSKLRKVEQPRE